MSVRAKFVCNDVSPDPQVPGGARQIQLSPVYTGSEENKAFFQSSPGGSISLWCTNPNATKQFEMGKEYYVDFIPAVGPDNPVEQAPTPGQNAAS